jgi:hypothetical protein
MSETWWGKKEVGSNVAVGDEKDGTEGELMINVGIPNCVRLPPQLGGHQVRVLRTYIAPCPYGCESVLHYELEGYVQLCECTTHNFLWYIRA